MKNVKNLKVYGQNKLTKPLALLVSVALGVTALGGCTAKKEEKTTSTPELTKNTVIESIVDNTANKIEELTPELTPEMEKNAAIILYLDTIAAKDENGKINVELIKSLKSRIDSTNMTEDFNSFLDEIQQKMITEGKIYEASKLFNLALNEEEKALFTDSELAEIKEDEAILEAIEFTVKLAVDELENGKTDSFYVIFKAITEDEPIIVNKNKFYISKLSPAGRALANMYAETVLYYGRNIIPEAEQKLMDSAMDDQNNKAKIASVLDILGNDMPVEESEINVEEVLNSKYTSVINLLKGKVNADEETIKDLVNYINIEYLTSSSVSYKDRNAVYGELTEEEMNAVIDLISAINKYNIKNPDNAVVFKTFLIDEFAKTDKGVADSNVMDYIQFNAYGLETNKDLVTDATSFRKIPYGANIFKYITKDNATFEVGENTIDIIWQNTTDGSGLVCYVIVYDTLKGMKDFGLNDNYIEKTTMDLNETIKSIQKSINDECEKGYELTLK